jgi:hypothetical protein
VVILLHAHCGNADTLMPHAALKFGGGANQMETPALNENSGLSQTNLIRYMPDPNGVTLVQKIGGWTRWFSQAMSAIVRALWAWEDLNLNSWLAVGTEGTPAQLSALAGGTLSNITPTQTSDNVTPAAASTAGSPSIVITDTSTTGITKFDSVYIATQISIGGVVLFGLYQCDPDGYLDTDSYTVQPTDILGNQLYPATSASAVLAQFSTTSGSGTVTVTLPGYTYAVGGTFTVLTPTTVGGITLYGNYIVQTTPGAAGSAVATYASPPAITMNNTFVAGQEVGFSSAGTLPTGLAADTAYFVLPAGLSSTQFEVSATPGGSAISFSGGSGALTVYYVSSTFTIFSPTSATSSATAPMNGGNAAFIYNFGIGAVPPLTGYGVGGYGAGGYGTGAAVIPAVGTPIDAVDWTLDNFGQDLVACAVESPGSGIPYQPIYIWTPGEAQATVIPEAPPVNDGIFVAMPQRQIIAWGSTETGVPDPLLINWSDVGNPFQWIALVTNQAGSFRIPTGSRIVGGIQGPQQGIIGTDVDIWSMQYIGPPLVYSFNQIGKGCGWISRKCFAFVNGIGYWMGPSQFFTLSAYGVQPLPCPVWDVIFQNLNTGIDPDTGVSNLQKIRVAVNSRFGEIQWFYPSAGGSGEVDSYVKYNLVLNVWDYGSLGRTAWIDQSILGPPIGADPASLYLYQHETSNDADGVAMNPSFQSGYFALNEGDVKTFIDWVWPDFKWGQYDEAMAATVQVLFLCADYPGDTPTVYGPYSVTAATEYFYTRLRARLLAVNISSSDVGSFWRIGNMRYRYSIDGKI